MATLVETDYGPVDIDTGEATGVSNGVQIFNPAIKATDDAGNPIIVLAIDGDMSLLSVDTDGKLQRLGFGSVQLDWRYDYKTEGWIDTKGESLEIAE